MDQDRATAGLRLATALVGLTILLGALLHPWLKPAMADQMHLIATSRLWVPAHWLLTVGQALVIPVLLAGTTRLRTTPALAIARGLLLVGLGAGTLGTLLAATGLHAAAQAGDATLFGVLADLDLGIGWLCPLLAAPAVATYGWIAFRRGPREVRWLAAVAMAAGVLLFLASAIIAYNSWLMHQVVLRSGALLLALVRPATASLLPTSTA